MTIDNFLLKKRIIEEKRIQNSKKYINNLINRNLIPKELDLPITIQLELTYKCNLKCKHCYNNSGNKMKNFELSFEEWKNFSKSIVKAGGVFQVILSGGEPLLLKNKLTEIMDIYHNDGSAFILISNGYLFSEIILNKLKKYRFYWIQISIDGHTNKIHDNFRGVNGSFDKAISACLNISETNIPLVIAHTVTSENIKYIDKMIELSYQLGASALILGEIFMSGQAFNKCSKYLLKTDEKIFFYEQIDKYRSKYEGTMDIAVSASCFYQLNKYKNYPNSGFIVRPNGDIRLDCMTPFVIGNIKKDNWLQVWNEKGKKAWQDERVIEYFSNIDINNDYNLLHKNYLDKDILI